MASRPVPNDVRAPGQRQALIVAAACGAGAALIALLILHNFAIAGGFAAGMLLLVGAAVVWSRFAPVASDAAGETDWSVARALAAASDDAIAVTDRAGRLICANERYRARFGGYPTPPALPLDDNGPGELAAAGRIAW
ncbi:MAG: hybrid sensor histidine kinase/response regulator, partial [Sphingomonadales bacterium]|nr:hybrid sensor histidine kinase/response regulator [Sphingomonadales bacterium]